MNVNGWYPRIWCKSLLLCSRERAEPGAGAQDGMVRMIGSGERSLHESQGVGRSAGGSGDARCGTGGGSAAAQEYVDARGGRFKLEDDWRELPETESGRVTSEEYWERITYFLKRIIPVARAGGQLGFTFGVRCDQEV